MQSAGNMETVDQDGERFEGTFFHSPYKDGRKTDRTVDSVSPTHLSSPSTDLLVYDSEYATSLAPSFSLSDSIRSGKDDGRQDAFLPTVDSSQSTSEQIRNIALRKLQLHGCVQGLGEGPTGEPVFKCLKCDEIFFGKQEVVNHVFIFHAEVEPYECQVCASSFRSKNSLKLHYLLVHTTKRMACDVCGDRFSDPSLFKSHRLFHELESHVCDVCNRQFNHYWSYRKHKRSHEQHLKQKNKCGFCLKRFYSERKYWQHMDHHNSSQMINCCRCDETFVEGSVLAEHWSSHEDELPQFLCPVSLHDGLPQQICYECLSRIELFHSYKQSCLESQHTLKHWNLFCDGGELKEDDVLNVNVTSNVVEDKDVNRQAMEAETQSSSSGDQLPKQKGFMNSPNSTYSQSCRGSPRISKHFERVGNSVGKREVQCEAVDRLARELRKDIASGTSVEHELAWMKTKSRKSSPMSVHCVSCNSKEAPAENCSPLSQQNSKIFVHRSKTQRDVHENCTGLDIQIQSAHSVSSLMQSPPKPDTGPVLTFLDSALEQFESEVECEVIDIPAGELRNNAPINTAKQRNSSPVSVHCVPSSCKEACTQNHTPLSQHSSETSVQDQRMHMDAPGSQSGVDIPIKRSSDKLSLIQTPVKVYSVPLTFPDSTSKRSEGEGDSVEGSEVECELAATSELRGNFSCTVAKRESAKMGPKGINKSPLSMRSVLCIGKKVPRQNCTLPSWHNVKTSVQDQRMEPNATGTHSVLDMPTERSSPVCLLTRSPLKAATGTVLTFPDSTSKEYEGEGNSVVESEIQSKAIETARDTEVSFSSTTVKREACSHTPLCEQNSKTSAPNKKVQACVTGMDIPKRRPSIMSPLICDTHSLVTFPDTVVKECSTDYYCHNDIENLEITTWLTEQERNVIASENVAVSSQRQNESIHTNLRTDHERQKYQSVHALLKVLESDEDSNSFESDIENTRVRKMLAHTMCRPPTPGPRGRRRNGSTERVIKDPVTAGVKVENLTENKKGTTLHVRSKVKRATAVASQAKKPRRPYSQKQKNQSNQYRLVKSVMDEATGKVRYKCLKCSSMLSHKHYIKEHMKIHTGDKSFVCSMCNRAFRNNYMLKSHVVVHLPEKNFECEVCKHRFLGKERLKQHMRLHTATPFVCTVCGRTCSQKQSLKRHMRVHTGERPYKCDSCDAAFADRSTWINHRRIHTGERPFKCKECNKTFSRHVNLHAHKRTHSDVRLFGCQLCMSRFKTKAHLVKHLSCIHKDLMKSVVNFMKEEQHLE